MADQATPETAPEASPEPISTTAAEAAVEANPAESASTPSASPAVAAATPPASMQELVDRGTPEQIEAALQQLDRGENPFAAPVQDEPAETETEDTQEPVAEAEAEESEQAAEAEPNDEPRLPKRLKINDRPIAEQVALTAAMDELRRNPKLSLKDALAKVGYLEAARETPAAEQEPAKAADAPKGTDHDAEIATLMEQRKAAQAAFDFDKASELDSQLDAARERRLMARLEGQQQAAQAQAQLQKQVSESVAAIRKVAPDFNTPGTPLQKAVESIGTEFEQTNPAFFSRPNWPQRLFALAWAEAHPDRPMPALKASNGTSPASVPKPALARKNGAPAAMLSAGRQSGDPVATLYNRALRPEATQAEILQALEALETPRAGRR